MAARSSRRMAGGRAQRQDSSRRVSVSRQRCDERHHHGINVEHQDAVLRNGTLCGKSGHLPDDREAQHVPGDTQSDESTSADAAAGQARAGPNQVSHRAAGDRHGESGAERPRRLRHDLLPTGSAAHRPVRLLLVLLFLLLPVPGGVRGRVEDKAGGGRATRAAPPRRGDAAHGEAAVRIRNDTLRSGRRRV